MWAEMSGSLKDFTKLESETTVSKRASGFFTVKTDFCFSSLALDPHYFHHSDVNYNES